MSKKTSMKRAGTRILTALLLLALMLSAAGCAGADKEGLGAEAFRRYYTQKAQTDTEHDYSHMNLDALEDMASDTVGTTVETEELTIQVRGAIIGGSRAEIILRVTAKKLDTVLRGDDGSAPENYRFGDETAALMQKYDFDSLACRYYYSDEDDSLAPNQFELHYWLVREPFDTEQCTIALTNFGYYESGAFTPLYTGSWTVDVSLVPAAETGRLAVIPLDLTAGGYKFKLETIEVSPLGCAVSMSCEEDAAYVSEHFNELYDAFLGESKSCVLTLADGTELADGQFSIESSNRDEFVFFISFISPIAIDDIAAVSLFGTELPFTFDDSAAAG